MSQSSSFWKYCGFVFLVLLATPFCAASDDAISHSAQLRINPTRPFSIQGLGFFNATVPVEILKEGSPDQEIVATLKGRFKHGQWNLLGPDQNILSPMDPEEQKRPFELKVPLTSDRTPVHFISVGPFGKVEEATVFIVYHNYVSSSEGANELPSLGGGWGVGLGVSSITYSQTTLPDLSEIALTPKVSYQHPLSHHWDLGGNIFMTALPITTNQSGVSAYFLGINVRAGYSLPIIPKPWTLSIAVGGYYTTMTSSGRDFGYRNMFGPQVFPVLRRSLGPKNMIGTYFKYSPVTGGGSPFNFSSHELATGLSLTHLLANRKSISFTLDYSQITVQISPIVATNTAITGGASYGF